MQKVAIVGVGLIGASFGLALRKAGLKSGVIGVSSPQALEAGLLVGAISETASLEEAVQRADVIYLSQPVDKIIETLKEIGPIVKKGSLITDAGSTKVRIVQAAAQYVKDAQFVGGHPMAGKELRGALASDADLFFRRPYILEPAISKQVTDFRHWLTLIGADIIEMSAEEHDAIVALTSHLPQMLSTALASYLAEELPQGSTKAAGSGLQDMTRLALSSPDLWSSIISTNSDNVKRAIDGYINRLSRLKAAVDKPEFKAIFENSASFSAKIRSKSG